MRAPVTQFFGQCICLGLFCLFLAACSSSATAFPTITATPTPKRTQTAQSTATRTPSPSLPPQPTETPTPVNYSPTPEVRICPPFPGYTLVELTAAISNPFKPPARPGSDDPHQAIDLAVEEYGMAVSGDPVAAVLAGRAAGIVREHFPYGHALLVETPLDILPADWLKSFQAPTPGPTLGPHPALTCPQVEEPLTWDSQHRSLYLLYAHLQAPVEFKLDDSVQCGQQIGNIGQSGNALNPHLHLEARVGPAGARFDSLAHYSGGITPLEMRNYCVWRVSGVFQLVDPNRLLALLP